MTVRVYTKTGCVQCDATFRALDKAVINYSRVDISTDHSAFDYVRSLGYSSAPVVVAAGQHWNGFRPDRINRLSKQELP